MPMVTVIITTFERTNLLREAVASALSQTFTDLEVLVSDDAGSNDVPRLLAEFDDRRINYRRNPRRLGLAGNTLSASLEARGKYVSYLNDDDVWERDFLATMVPALEASDDVVIAFSDHYVTDTSGRTDLSATDLATRQRGREGLAPGIHRSFARIGLIHRAILMGLSAVVRRAPLDWTDFPVEAGCYADCWITYMAWRTGLAAHYEPRRLTRYRRHSGAMTYTDVSPCALAGAFCYGLFLQDPRLRHLRSELMKRRAKVLVAPVVSDIKNGFPSEARAKARLALRMQVSPITVFLSLLTLLPDPMLVGTGAIADAARDAWPSLPRPLA